MPRQGMNQFRDSSYNRNMKQKIRVICHDPDATDSSSGDEDSNKACSHKKQYVHEITIEFKKDKIAEKKRVLGEPVRRQVAEKKRVSGEPGRRLRNSSKFRGVRLRQSGKWAAEIRHPVDNSKVWLGTYNSEVEAARAFQLKKAEFESLAAATFNCSNTGVLSGDAESLVISHSGPESLFEMVSNVGKNCDAAKEVMSAEEKFTAGDDLLDIQMELDSLFVNEHGQVFEDFSLLDDLPDFDFDLGTEELGWIGEPFNAACCP